MHSVRAPLHKRPQWLRMACLETCLAATPFSAAFRQLRRGIVIATAHVRGGGEHGRRWHLAGTVHRKWAALYDYAAAMNYLVEAGISEPGRIACDAFSAGACQRPPAVAMDVCAACAWFICHRRSCRASA